jgi:hypothetical protein
MFKSTLAALVALLILSSTAFAAPKCSLLVTGSYVRQVYPATPYIDQLTLSIDGTAYWFSSLSFDQILTGAFIPQIGSWKCLADGSVLVTTIGTNYLGNPLPVAAGTNIYILDNLRFTQKLSVVDFDTLQATHRISTNIPLSDDPLGPGSVSGCKPSGTPCNPAPYKRVKPLPTDITP